MIRKGTFVLIMLIPMLGCVQKRTVSFDSDSWKKDMHGCNEERLGLYSIIIEKQGEILGMTNKQVIKVLGRPERNELYRRNQKFFIYNITPGEKCDRSDNDRQLFLFVRFNAVGLSQEVFVQESPTFKDSRST